MDEVCLCSHREIILDAELDAASNVNWQRDFMEAIVEWLKLHFDEVETDLKHDTWVSVEKHLL